jgi:hypothetical protein
MTRETKVPTHTHTVVDLPPLRARTRISLLPEV